MPPLFPPDYPYRPDAPLLSFGPSFSEEISRSVIRAVWHSDPEQVEEGEVTIAAALTMFEGFHPRDHLECMMSAQMVGLHSATMDSLARALCPALPDALVLKYRANAVQLTRGYSLMLRDLERRQGKDLPERPVPPESPPPPGTGTAPPDHGPSPDRADLGPPRSAGPITAEDAGERPEDIETRPDGTPGSLAAYAPKPPVSVYVPREPAIMTALATRGKPWRMVNAQDDAANEGDAADSVTGEGADMAPAEAVPHGMFDPGERMLTGDALARFTSVRLDPDAPVDALDFSDEYSEVELELISTGGDPELEAERQALISAHPEGKPIRTIRYGNKKPPDRPPDDG
jgi:hypothetical protein